MSVRTYDPKQVIITIGGVPMSGFSDGTFLTVDRDDDQWAKVTGAGREQVHESKVTTALET